MDGWDALTGQQLHVVHVGWTNEGGPTMDQGSFDSVERERFADEAGHAAGYSAGTILLIVIVVLLLIWIL